MGEQNEVNHQWWIFHRFILFKDSFMKRDHETQMEPGNIKWLNCHSLTTQYQNINTIGSVNNKAMLWIDCKS